MDNTTDMNWRKPIERADPSLPQRLGLCGDNSGVPVEGAVIIKLLSLQKRWDEKDKAAKETIAGLRLKNEALVKEKLKLADENKYLHEEKKYLSDELNAFHRFEPFSDDAWWQATRKKMKTPTKRKKTNAETRKNSTQV